MPNDIANNMADTINQLDEQIKELEAKHWDECRQIAHYDDEIKRLETTGVQPVKHGKWETWGYVFHGIEWERCSVCGKTADISYIALLEGRIEPVTASFCGCCGAKMIKDGEKE